MNAKVSNGVSRMRALFAVLALGLVVRGAIVVGLSGSLQADPDGYRRLAENVRTSGVYTTTGAPTAFRPPLYPALLALTVTGGGVSLTAVVGLHVVLGAGTILLTFVLAEACGLRRGAFLAAGLVAIDPILLNQSALVMTETLATLLAAAGMLALANVSRRPSAANAALAGACLGLAALCRPTFLPWLGIAGVLLGCGYSTAFPGKPGVPGSARSTRAPASGLRFNIQLAAVYLAVAAFVISPWVVRNSLVLGQPKVTTTHGGYTVLLGNNPSFYRYLRSGASGTKWDSSELASRWAMRAVSTSSHDSLWDLSTDTPSTTLPERVSRSEFEDDAFAYSLARRYIADEPGMFVYACCVRVARLWQVVPYPRGDSESAAQRVLRGLTGIWYATLLVLAACGAVGFRHELRRSPLVWGVVLCFSFTAVHSIYWSNMRMRAPLMPMVCLLASLAASALTQRLRRRAESPR